MPNYQETSVTGSKYRRAFHVACSNPITGAKAVTFNEEEVVTLAGVAQPITRTGPGFSLTIDHDPEGEIAILNPATDAPTGTTVSHDYLYLILYSLYRQAAAARDNA